MHIRQHRSPPLVVAVAVPGVDAWLNPAIAGAIGRWRAQHRDAPPFCWGDDPDILVELAELLPGVSYQPVRAGRTVAPRLRISPAVGAWPATARAQLVAQALGAAAGVPLRNPKDDPRPGIMHAVPPNDWPGRTAVGSHRDERASLRKRLRLHELERLRLDAPRLQVRAYDDQRLIEFGPPCRPR